MFLPLRCKKRQLVWIETRLFSCFRRVLIETINSQTSKGDDHLKPLTVKSAAITIFFTILCSVNGFAQTQTAQPTPTPMPSSPAANPDDVKSMESIIAAVYDVISGPAGKERDWNRFRSLFVNGARLIPTFPAQTGGFASRALTVDEYVQRAQPRMTEEGFYEKEFARRVEQFGQIAHVFSTYESRHKAEDTKPFARGINSIQLMNDGKRWWIVTIFWQGESETTPLPDKYLKSGE